MIKTEYRVTVDIPEAVWRSHAHDPAFERARIEACSGHVESGTDFYGAPFEWAVFDSLTKAQRCEQQLRSVMVSFREKLLSEKPE